jgi:hypothetical protein
MQSFFFHGCRHLFGAGVAMFPFGALSHWRADDGGLMPASFVLKNPETEWLAGARKNTAEKACACDRATRA